MSGKPYVKIMEQPCKKMRFKCPSEDKVDYIYGAKSTKHEKTYPTIQIVNKKGPAVVVVSCITKDEPYRSHPCNIIGKSKTIKDGIRCVEVPDVLSTVQFTKMGIESVRDEDIIKCLDKRQSLTVDPFRTGYKHKMRPDTIDLTSVRLCFQVFLQGTKKDLCNVPLYPVVSEPITNIIAVPQPKILWMSHYSAPVSGDALVCLLCGKVSRSEIQVRFFDPSIEWEAIAEFVPPEYHRPSAVVFKTPKYIVQDINDPVQVYLQLKRLSDGEVSAPVAFEFFPIEYDSEDGFRVKRQKCRETPMDLFLKNLKETADQNVNSTVSTNAFPIVQTNQWGLPATTMHNSNIVQEPTYFSPYNQMNVYSEIPSTSNAVDTGFNHAYNNGQPIMTQNHTMNNDFTQLINFENN